MRIDINKRLSQQEIATPISNFTSPVEFTFSIDLTVGDVLHTLRSRKINTQVDYFYITDHDNTLQGIITLLDLLYSPPEASLGDIVDTEVLKVYEDEPLEKALKLLTKHQLLVLPVLNREERLVGVLEIVPHDGESLYKSKKLHQKRVKEDIFQFIGFSIEQGKLTSIWTEFRYRMPWLACNLAGGLICAVIGEMFQLALVEFVVLALFIPLILTLSESISIQSMTLSLRFMHLKKIHWSQIWRRILVEWKTSFFLGVTSALIITAFYFAWSVNIMPIIAIGSSIIMAMVASATFGALFPIALHLCRLDPKVAAGPVCLMVADIVTITIYLGMSTLLLV